MKKGSHHSPEALKRMRKGCKRAWARFSPEERVQKLAGLTRLSKKRWADRSAREKQRETLERYWSGLDSEKREQRLKAHRQAMAKPKTRKKISKARKAFLGDHPQYLDLIRDAGKRRFEEDPDFVERFRKAHKDFFADPQNKKRHAEAISTELAKIKPRLRERSKRIMASNPPGERYRGTKQSGVGGASRQ
jgi:hypothetical protein